MSGWTVGHPSPIWYTLGPSHFLMTSMPTTTYRPFMHEVSTEGPLIIPSIYGTQHSYAHSSLRMHDGNQECKDRNQPKAKKRSNRDHNPTWKLNQEGIQSVTVDHPDVAQILTGICID
ncbi:hypothetical protein GOBAR_AA14023 [Gossypium barbadense]|uniref:Uncharacterized protein n=1 Tax=Gossypium barbadense TaxID=3634 RepID=A0A2P5XTF8_GOSBA|nr:hypothetical protein GOBAR_AA14023 [Gossypium barbadense]